MMIIRHGCFTGYYIFSGFKGEGHKRLPLSNVVQVVLFAIRGLSKPLVNRGELWQSGKVAVVADFGTAVKVRIIGINKRCLFQWTAFVTNSQGIIPL
jgi:hypothetical protein